MYNLDQGMEAAYKFIQKLWKLHNKILKTRTKQFDKNNNESLYKNKYTNFKNTDNLEILDTIKS